MLAERTWTVNTLELNIPPFSFCIPFISLPVIDGISHPRNLRVFLYCEKIYLGNWIVKARLLMNFYLWPSREGPPCVGICKYCGGYSSWVQENYAGFLCLKSHIRSSDIPHYLCYPRPKSHSYKKQYNRTPAAASKLPCAQLLWIPQTIPHYPSFLPHLSVPAIKFDRHPLFDHRWAWQTTKYAACRCTPFSVILYPNLWVDPNSVKQHWGPHFCI